MSESWQGLFAGGYKGRAVNRGLATAAVSVAAIGLLAGCRGSSAPAAGSTTAAGGAAATASVAGTVAAGTGATATAASSAVAFIPVTEPFDPGHPARSMSAPANCGAQQTTLAMEQCYENKTETADAAADSVRRAGFAAASPAQRAAINVDDRDWLAARTTVCGKAYQTGGTIDGINIASCLLDESTARLDALKGITPPEAVLRSTDSTSLSDLSYYTTPEGSRIAMIDTQGDATGGVIIAWVIIAGADGFTVSPAQFTYRDGTFADAGTVQGPDPAGHRVAPGTEYQFSIDYSRLPADPSAGKGGASGGGGGWVYSAGTPVAIWH